LILREQEKNFPVHTFFCSRRIKIGQNWTKLDKTGQNWTKLDKTGQKFVPVPVGCLPLVQPSNRFGRYLPKGTYLTTLAQTLLQKVK
jgi:hypothetical protein